LEHEYWLLARKAIEVSIADFAKAALKMAFKIRARLNLGTAKLVKICLNVTRLYLMDILRLLLFDFSFVETA